jgi:hypothetical protein
LLLRYLASYWCMECMRWEVARLSFNLSLKCDDPSLVEASNLVEELSRDVVSINSSHVCYRLVLYDNTTYYCIEFGTIHYQPI